MALRITKSTDPVNVTRLTVCVYSQPGLGKTSLGFTATQPLLLDFDHGKHRSGNRGDAVDVQSWSDVVSITAADLKDYKTIVVDTAGRALDMLTQEIISDDPKLGRGGALTLQGYGVLKTQFTAWIKMVMALGLDVVLLVHSDEQRKGDEVIERLDVQGGSKNEIYKIADVMGKLYMQGEKRNLTFNPTETSFGKNPGRLPPITVPDFRKSENLGFLGHVIEQIKTELNKLSEGQKKIAEALANFQSIFSKIETLEEFNTWVTDAQEVDATVRDNVKRLLLKAGKDKGFKFDTKAKLFVAPPKAEEQKAEEPKSEAQGQPE